MSRRAALSLIAACGLSACAHHTEPQAMAGMTWAYNGTGQGGADSLLAFGSPDTDRVLLTMRCQPHSAQVAMSISVPQAQPNTVLELRSDGQVSTYSATASADGTGGGSLVELNAAPNDPVLKHFADTGELTLTVNGLSTRLPPARQKDAAQFFDTCRF